MKSISLKIFCCFFLAGVFLYSTIEISASVFFVILTWSVFLCFTKNKKLFFVAIAVLALSIGYLRALYNIPQAHEGLISFYHNENLLHIFQGEIVANPDRRREKVNYIVEAQRISIDGQWREIDGRVLISSDLYPEYNYGDTVEISGYIIEPAEFDTFSYKDYLTLYSVYSVMYRPRIKLVGEGGGSLFFASLFSLKDGFEDRLNKLYPEPMASFEAGLLTGSRKGIPDDLLKSFNLTGLTHIIAISGYNISLIIILISSLLKKFSRNVKIPIVIVFIIVFTLFVGASAAVVRASIMGVIAVLALWFGRQSQIISALLLSALVMVFWNPPTLLYDVGFQLSFLATLGLIVSGNFLQRIFAFLPASFGFQEAFAMTLSAQVFALPVILLNFQRFSLISPVANVFVVPLIPLAMLFGFISVVLSMVHFSLGFVFTFPAWFVLKICVLITHFLANLPFASMETPWFSVWFLVGYYLLFILLTYFVYPYFRNVLRRD
ncbi:ComEC/Rec2 family competence protein [Patescibacteria group bacterium]